jgi:hypothetical protein
MKHRSEFDFNTKPYSCDDLGEIPSGEVVDHPAHYGGKHDPYEAIKVIEAWCLGFHLGNCVKYISRAGKKPWHDFVTDLEKARWYLDRKIEEAKNLG